MRNTRARAQGKTPSFRKGFATAKGIEATVPSTTPNLLQDPGINAIDPNLLSP